VQGVSPPLFLLPSPITLDHRFGFIKYHNFEDAEDCIRGFHYLGYEVSFARVRHCISICFSHLTDLCQESFYSKLKKFSDEQNTNLYVSNIPKNMNEHVRYTPLMT
jgi:RNA recognition motif-containing protein